MAGGHEHEMILVILLDRQHRIDLLTVSQRQQVHHRLAARIAPGLRQLIHLEPVHLPAVREAQQRVVRVRHKELLDEVLVLHRRGGLAPPTAPLRLVVGHRLRLRIAAVRERHHDVLRLNEVFGGQVKVIQADLGAARIAEQVADLDEFIAHDFGQALGPGEDVAQVADDQQQLLVFGDDLVLLKPRKAVQSHVEDGLRLGLTQAVTLRLQTVARRQAIRPGADCACAFQHGRHRTGGPYAGYERGARLGRIRRSLDQGNDFINVGQRDRQAFQHMGTLARLAQVENRAPCDHLATVADERLQHVLEGHQLGLAVLQGDHVDAEHGLQRRLRIEVVEHDVGQLTALELNDNAHAVLVGLIPQAIGGDALQQLLAHQVGDALNEARLVHLIGQLGDDNGLSPALFHVLEVRTAPDRQSPTARAIGSHDFLGTIDDAGRWKVRTRHVLHEASQGDVRILHDRQQGVDNLGEIVRRDVGGHAHGNTGGAIEEQVRNACRQDRWLPLGFVIIGNEIDRFLVDISQQLMRQARHAHLGVTHGGRHIAVDRAEVALAIDQQVAHGEGLRHADNGVVHGLVAVRVVLADHVADDARRLLVGLVVLIAQFAHGEQNAPVHGLEAIAHIGKGPPDDDAHGVIEVRLPHLVFEIHGQDFACDFRHCAASQKGPEF